MAGGGRPLPDGLPACGRQVCAGQAIREKTARKEVKKAQRAREKEAPASKNE